MDKHGISLGLYLRHDGEAVWLYDVVEKGSDYVCHVRIVENYYYGFWSFHKEKVTEKTYTITHEDLYSTVNHKKREMEKWTFLGKLVPQGMFYQIV